MDLQSFINKWEGKSIDFDEHYGPQCVDLFRQYCKEVLDIPQPHGIIGAKDFWEKYANDSILISCFDRVENAPLAVPEQGDIMIWNKNVGGGFGHVGIVIDGDVSWFSSFDQNWAGVQKCRIVNHKYTNVLGWLHFKNGIIGEDMALETQIGEWIKGKFTEFQLDINKYQDIISQWRDRAGQLKGKEDELIKWNEFRDDLRDTLKETVSQEFKDILARAGDLRESEVNYQSLQKIYANFIKHIAELLNTPETSPDALEQVLQERLNNIPSEEEEGGDSNMTKKVDYPAVKKALWDGWRVFVPVFVATLAGQFQAGFNLQDWQTWLRSTLAAAVVAGVKAVVKWAREVYAKGDYQNWLYKLPT